MRHGQTAWNAVARMQGQLDIPLDDTGRWQAERLAEALAAEPIMAIYSSDLQRAMATAAPLAAVRGLRVMTERGLRERGFGIFEGHAYAEIEARWPEETQRWRRRDPDFGPPGGETLRGFAERAVAAALRCVARHPGQTVALVAHGGVLDALHRAALGIPLEAPRTWQLNNAAVNRLLFNGERFTLVGWDDAAHLARAGGSTA